MPHSQYEFTNANDVIISVAGEQGGNGGNMIVADWTFTETKDDDLVHGAGNHGPQGITHGNVEYEFDITLEGDHARAYDTVSESPDNPPDFKITARGPHATWTFPHAWPQDIEYSGEDGEIVEISISGLALEPNR